MALILAHEAVAGTIAGLETTMAPPGAVARTGIELTIITVSSSGMPVSVLNLPRNPPRTISKMQMQMKVTQMMTVALQTLSTAFHSEMLTIFMTEGKLIRLSKTSSLGGFALTFECIQVTRSSTKWVLVGLVLYGRILLLNR